MGGGVEGEVDFPLSNEMGAFQVLGSVALDITPGF